MNLTNPFRIALIVLAVSIVAGCATGPTIRTAQDEDADFDDYQTYGWAPELGTDRAGYSTLTTDFFKDAVRDEMEALGYRYTEVDPDLFVNFHLYVRERTETYTTPGPYPTFGTGYYGYRYGLYTVWPGYGFGPGYGYEVRTVHYKVGTMNIDLVDADERQLVWEGVAEGTLSEDELDNLGEAIDDAVEDIFDEFPAGT